MGLKGDRVFLNKFGNYLKNLVNIFYTPSLVVFNVFGVFGVF